MFVFPAFNTSFKQRKRTFKCCTHCRIKRVRCVLSENFESLGCATCLKCDEKCDLVTSRESSNEDEQKENNISSNGSSLQSEFDSQKSINNDFNQHNNGNTEKRNSKKSVSSTQSPVEKNPSPAKMIAKQEYEATTTSSPAKRRRDSVFNHSSHNNTNKNTNEEDDEDDAEEAGLVLKVKRTDSSQLGELKRRSISTTSSDIDDLKKRSLSKQIHPSSNLTSPSFNSTFLDSNNHVISNSQPPSTVSSHFNEPTFPQLQQQQQPSAPTTISNHHINSNQYTEQTSIPLSRPSSESQINFVSTADSLIKILNLPYTREDGSSEIRKSNSVTAFQAMSSKYIGVTDATAVFIQVAGSRKDKKERKDSVSEATGGALEGDFNEDGSPKDGKDTSKDDKIPDYHSAAWWPKAGKKRSSNNNTTTNNNANNNNRANTNDSITTSNDNNSNSTTNDKSHTAESKTTDLKNHSNKNQALVNSVSLENKLKDDSKRQSSVIANEAIRDMLGVFVKSTERRTTPYKNAINYGPFTLPRSLFLYLKEDCNCFEIGLTKQTQLKLIELYFEKFNTILPLLSEESSYTTFKNNHMPTLILYALILLASRVDGAEEILQQDGITDVISFNKELEFKVRTMLQFKLDENKLTLLRTYALLAMYGGGGAGSSYDQTNEKNSNGLEASSLDLTIAIHHAFTLGIHHNHYAQQLKNKKDTSISNAWWCLFILDRINCLINSRTMIINRRDSSLPLPVDKNLNSIVQAIIRLERVLSLYQPLGDNRIVPKDIDFDVYSDGKPIETLKMEGKNIGSECLRRLIVCITIMFAQKRKYDLLDTNSANYKQEKAIPDDLYCKSGLQILNITSRYMKFLPPINFIPYSISYTLSCFLKIDLMNIKNEDLNGVEAKENISEWSYPLVLEFLNSLSKQYWYAGSTYKLCAEYLTKLQVSSNIAKSKSFITKFKPTAAQSPNVVIKQENNNECSLFLQPEDYNNITSLPSFLNMNSPSVDNRFNGINTPSNTNIGLPTGLSSTALQMLNTPDFAKLQSSTFSPSGPSGSSGLLNQKLEIDETLANFANQHHFEFLATSAVKNSSNLPRAMDYYRSPATGPESVATTEDGTGRSNFTFEPHYEDPLISSVPQNPMEFVNQQMLQGGSHPQAQAIAQSQGHTLHKGKSTLAKPASSTSLQAGVKVSLAMTNLPEGFTNQSNLMGQSPTSQLQFLSQAQAHLQAQIQAQAQVQAQLQEQVQAQAQAQAQAHAEFASAAGSAPVATENPGIEDTSQEQYQGDINDVTPSSEQSNSNDQLLLLFNELPNVHQFFGQHNMFGYNVGTLPNSTQNSPTAMYHLNGIQEEGEEEENQGLNKAFDDDVEVKVEDSVDDNKK